MSRSQSGGGAKEGIALEPFCTYSPPKKIFLVAPNNVV